MLGLGLVYIFKFDLPCTRTKKVKSFSGATVNDMEDYLKPVLRKEPNKIILHVGTNDLKSVPANRVAEGIANLGTQIKEESPATSIVISSILPRSDNADLSAKALEVNRLTKSICSKNKWGFIEHKTVNKSCLNSRGLHLNNKELPSLRRTSQIILVLVRILPIGSQLIRIH